MESLDCRSSPGCTSLRTFPLTANLEILFIPSIIVMTSLLFKIRNVTGNANEDELGPILRRFK